MISGIAPIRQLSEATRPWIESACSLEWHPEDGFGPIIIRAALRRQLETIEVVVDLVQNERAFAAVAMLRPACEELLWLRYLAPLPTDLLRRLAAELVRSGIRRDLEAQAAEIGETGMSDLGLNAVLLGFRNTVEDDSERVRELGRELSWPEQATKHGRVPSAWFIAAQTDSTDLYRFMYHATSRYAHFSPVELARQGWGRTGSLRIEPGNYEPQWAAFVLCWAPRLFAWSVLASVEHIAATQNLELDWPKLEGALTTLASQPLVPIITGDELLWGG